MFRVAGAAFLVSALTAVVTNSTTAGSVVFFVVFALIAAANVGKLRCPACRKRVKLGATRCHHCGENVKPFLAR